MAPVAYLVWWIKKGFNKVWILHSNILLHLEDSMALSSWFPWSSKEDMNSMLLFLCGHLKHLEELRGGLKNILESFDFAGDAWEMRVLWSHSWAHGKNGLLRWLLRCLWWGGWLWWGCSQLIPLFIFIIVGQAAVCLQFVRWGLPWKLVMSCMLKHRALRLFSLIVLAPVFNSIKGQMGFLPLTHVTHTTSSFRQYLSRSFSALLDFWFLGLGK